MVDDRGRTPVSENKDWCTPRKIVTALNEFWPIGAALDPCSNPGSIVNARCKIVLPEDGLSIDWNQYGTIFVNPPYGRDPVRKTTIANWIEKCSKVDGDGEVIALIPVATNTKHWKQYIFNVAKAVCFIFDSRLKFRINGSEDNKGCPMACCLVYWGSDWDRFNRTFSRLGYCVQLT